MHLWWEIKIAWTVWALYCWILYHCNSSFEADDCAFVYTQQPPSNLSCNPCNSETSPPQLNLTLACEAQRTDDKKNQWTFDLRWFSNYSCKELNHVPRVRTHPLINSSVLVTSPGQYWCQVLEYTEGGSGHLLGRSNVAEVFSCEWYSSLPMCEGVQSVMESKCADLSTSSSVSPTTNHPPMCFVPKTEIQTRTITGEHAIAMQWRNRGFFSIVYCSIKLTSLLYITIHFNRYTQY